MGEWNKSEDNKSEDREERPCKVILGGSNPIKKRFNSPEKGVGT
jgi:hypothetical protein